jgi:hypothetical protein
MYAASTFSLLDHFQYTGHPSFRGHSGLFFGSRLGRAPSPAIGVSSPNHGELCLAHESSPNHGPAYFLFDQQPSYGSALIWALSDANPACQVRRHVIDVPLPIRMTTAFDDHAILFQGQSHSLECINSQSGEVVSSVTSMHDMRYHHPETNMIVE